jgi:hypothetical protein
MEHRDTVRGQNAELINVRESDFLFCFYFGVRRRTVLEETESVLFHPMANSICLSIHTETSLESANDIES